MHDIGSPSPTPPGIICSYNPYLALMPDDGERKAAEVKEWSYGRRDGCSVKTSTDEK